jgi:hypothetical protein
VRLELLSGIKEGCSQAQLPLSLSQHGKTPACIKSVNVVHVASRPKSIQTVSDRSVRSKATRDGSRLAQRAGQPDSGCRRVALVQLL